MLFERYLREEESKDNIPMLTLEDAKKFAKAGYYIRFSERPHVEIPKEEAGKSAMNSVSTPVGFYGWDLAFPKHEEEFLKIAENGNGRFPFGDNRKYIHIMKPNTRAKVLDLASNEKVPFEKVYKAIDAWFEYFFARTAGKKGDKDKILNLYHTLLKNGPRSFGEFKRDIEETLFRFEGYRWEVSVGKTIGKDTPPWAAGLSPVQAASNTLSPEALVELQKMIDADNKNQKYKFSADDVEQIYLFGRKQFVGLLEGLLFPNGRPYGAFDSGIEPSDLYRMIMWISAIGMASTQRYDTTKMLLAMGYNIVKDGADGGPLYSERERGQAAFLTDKAVKHVAVFKNPAGILGFK